MKLAFLLLVLVNVLLFAWQHGVFGHYGDGGREPERAWKFFTEIFFCFK